VVTHAFAFAQGRLRRLDVLEANEPVNAEAIDHLAVGCSPRAFLELVDNGALGSQLFEPAREGAWVRGTQQGEHHAFGSETGLSVRRVRDVEIDRPTHQLTMSVESGAPSERPNSA
jgi:hypothetical protein